MSQLCSETYHSDDQVQEFAPSNTRPLIIGRCVEKQAPWGWTFVAIGIPALTNRCLELSQAEGLGAQVVSLGPNTPAHENPDNLAYHLHRAGYHIHSRIVKKAMEELHIIPSDEKACSNDDASVEPYSHALIRQLDQYLRQHGLAPGQFPVSLPKQEDVSNLIQDLFPQIPEADQAEVLDRAFAENSGSVIGSGAALSLARRVQLAVLAHLRHKKTDYNLQLRKTPSDRVGIRDRVEPMLVEYIKQWRGEDSPEPEEDYEDYEGYAEDDHEGYAQNEEEYDHAEHSTAKKRRRAAKRKRFHRTTDGNDYDWKPPGDTKERLARLTPAWVKAPHEGFYVPKDKQGKPFWPNKIVFDD